tara:strand:+ start:59 stop:334 length:276 start_codon:yes stop_codon:yes gene_type:complete
VVVEVVLGTNPEQILMLVKTVDLEVEVLEVIQVLLRLMVVQVQLIKDLMVDTEIEQEADKIQVVEAEVLLLQEMLVVLHKVVMGGMVYLLL